MEQPTPETLDQQQTDAAPSFPEVVDLRIRLPNKKSIFLPSVSVGESLNNIRLTLADFQETAFITSFKWKFVHTEDAEKKKLDVGVVRCDEFTEIASLVAATSCLLTLEIVEDVYDVQKVRQHVQRLHSVLQRPFLLPALVRSPQSGAERGAEPSEEGEAPSAKTDKKNSSTKSSDKVALPSLETVLESPSVGKFYGGVYGGEVEAARAKAAGSASSPLADAIKSISFSGWNPVPAGRKASGDLLYLEVVMGGGEGTVHLTATPK